MDAPGEPGQPPRWIPTGKSGVGRSLRDDSRVWFTVGNGILNEIAYPRIEQTSVRDFGLIVTDGRALFAEERRDCASVTVPLAPGVPAYRILSTHDGGRFRLHKRIIADPVRPAILQHVRLEDLAGPGLDGAAAPLRLHALLAPHLVNVTGMGTAWIGEYKGVQMLFAEAQGTAVALAASSGWLARSAGYAGISDGWQDLHRHRHMAWQYERAFNGNVALTGELVLDASPDGVVVVLAFGRIWTEAAMRARAALLEPFAGLEEAYASGWQRWLVAMRPLDAAVDAKAEARADAGAEVRDAYRSSLMVIRTHECPSVPGARIASLGVPWAALQNDAYPAACHLVRGRDVAAAAGALLAAGDAAPVREALAYLCTVQEADGHWPQNFWPDGMAAWQGLQLDEIAQPVLLADLALRAGALAEEEVGRYWPMVRRAALCLARHDPLDGQDRWGRTDGLKLHTLGTEIAALLAAAAWAGQAGDAALRGFLEDTADSIHELLGALLDEPGSPASADAPEADPDIVSLPRLGVLSPDDPRLLRALRTVDAELRVELPGGPAWSVRGEAGQPPRPVLTAERALLAVLQGRPDEARALLSSLQACAGEGGMLPERIEAPGGRGGMVMPHLWTHAEHVRLLRSIADGVLFDRPPHAAARYGSVRPSRIARWRHEHELREMPQGRQLRIELPVAADLHWSDDGWVRIQDTPVVQAGPGIFVAELPTAALPDGSSVVFTWRERGSGAWLGVDHHVAVVATDAVSGRS